MKVRALNDNGNHWSKGDTFKVHKNGNGDCYIICNCSGGSIDRHWLFDGDNKLTTNPADCPDFEVIQ